MDEDQKTQNEQGNGVFDGNQIDPQFSIALKDFLNKNGVGSLIEGHSSNPTLSSIGINNTGTYFTLDFQTSDFATGITYGTTGGGNKGFTVKTTGKYLVYLAVGFGTEPVAGGTEQRAGIKKNGTLTSEGITINQGVGGESSQAVVTDILNLVVGDYLEFFAMHKSNQAITVSNGATLTYAAIAKI